MTMATLIRSQEPPPPGEQPLLDRAKWRRSLWVSQQRAIWRGRIRAVVLFTSGSTLRSGGKEWPSPAEKFLAIVEVGPADPAVDYGPWPYVLEMATPWAGDCTTLP